LCVRFVFMALTGHHDALFIPWISNPIQYGHWQIYDYMATVRASETGRVATVNWTSNPPLSYYTLAAWMFCLRAIGLLDTAGWDVARYSAWELTHVPRTLFLTKIVYLAADLGIWAIVRGTLAGSQRRTFDLIWLLSPITLLGAYLMGQTDILATFWVVCALALAHRSLAGTRPELSAILAVGCLGVGAGYKLWPLLLLPLWAIVLGRRPIERIGLLCWGGLPFLAAIAPFFSSKAFQDSVVFGFGIGFLQPNMSGWFQSASPFIVAWGLVHVVLLFVWPIRSFDVLWKSAFFILCAYFTLTTAWEFYWLVWLMPFLALAIAQLPGAFWLYGYICVHFLLYTISGWDPGVGFMLPLGNVFFDTVAAGVPRLRNVLFAGDEMMLRRIAVISFSLFVVALWGIVVLTLARRWLPMPQQTAIEQRRIANWEGYAPIALLLVYAVTSIWIMTSSSPTPVSQFAANFLQTIERDSLFFGLLSVLIVLAAFSSLPSLAASRDKNTSQ